MFKVCYIIIIICMICKGYIGGYFIEFNEYCILVDNIYVYRGERDFI